MAHRLLYDPDEDGWERSDFPIVCETCLGPNPYVRMQRIEYGGTCHISGRPYTVFRWRPGSDARYKKTIICQEIAKAKNVCQVCLLDLEYGLPVQVRDAAAGIEPEDVPNSDVNKEYALELQKTTGELGQQYKQMPTNDTLKKVQRITPFYKRNQAPVCTFFIRGECNRGAECPYRHEMPSATDLSEQNIKDRYYGVNDPVAEKILQRMQDLPNLTPPEDPSVTTLYIGGVSPDIMETDLRDVFYAYGELTSVKIVTDKNCAFVTYSKREDAERAANALTSQVKIRNANCKLMWGRPASQKTSIDHSINAQGTGVLYPSMDPTAMGSFVPPVGTGKRPMGTDGVDGRSKKSKVSDVGPSGFGVDVQREELSEKSVRKTVPRPRPPSFPPPKAPPGPPPAT
eukprot:g5091.t1